MWQGRRVVLGVTGGIAAYKSVLLARALTERGALVDVVLSRGAEAFVGAVTFEAVTRRPVRTSLWERGRALDHVSLPHEASLIILAPATAHLLARAAAGLADDLLTALLLASTAPVLVAPAMNDAMFAHPATRANLDRLRSMGWSIVGPERGALAEGPSDRPGRMSEPETILAHAERLLHSGGPWVGKRVVVTAGPTREGIDEVRVVTNRSSGKMGYALASAAWRRGADVHLISGPTPLAPPVGVTFESVETTAEMAGAVRAALGSADALIMAAAPADFRPAGGYSGKRPKGEGALTLELVPTEDILLGTRDARRPGMMVVGFALETGDALAKGRAKLDAKGLDLIVINDAREPGAGFEVDTNRVTLLRRGGDPVDLPLAGKDAVAVAILDAMARARG